MLEKFGLIDSSGAVAETIAWYFREIAPPLGDTKHAV